MSTLSVPLSGALEAFIDSMVKRGFASNKAEVVRRALQQLSENEAVASVLRAEQELNEGIVLKGDLKKLMKAMP